MSGSKHARLRIASLDKELPSEMDHSYGMIKKSPTKSGRCQNLRYKVAKFNTHHVGVL